MLPKLTDADTIWRNKSVARAFADDKVEREASHYQIKTPFSQVLEYFDDGGFEKARVPEDMLLGPFPKNTRRFLRPGLGIHVEFVDKRAGGDDIHEAEPVIPQEFRELKDFQRTVRVFNHVIDRSSVNV